MGKTTQGGSPSMELWWPCGDRGSEWIRTPGQVEVGLSGGTGLELDESDSRSPELVGRRWQGVQGSQGTGCPTV